MPKLRLPVVTMAPFSVTLTFSPLPLAPFLPPTFSEIDEASFQGATDPPTPVFVLPKHGVAEKPCTPAEPELLQPALALPPPPPID